MNTKSELNFLIQVNNFQKLIAAATWKFVLDYFGRMGPNHEK